MAWRAGARIRRSLGLCGDSKRATFTRFQSKVFEAQLLRYIGNQIVTSDDASSRLIKRQMIHINFTNQNSSKVLIRSWRCFERQSEVRKTQKIKVERSACSKTKKSKTGLPYYFETG